MQATHEEWEDEGQEGSDNASREGNTNSGGGPRSRGDATSRASSATSAGGGGLQSAASKRSLHSSQSRGGSRGSSRGGQSSQVQCVRSPEPSSKTRLEVRAPVR